MTDSLHITNGDSASELLKESGINGTVLPWRDVLHDGPVPEGLNLDSLSEVRARYISALDWGNYNTVLHDFRERDNTLKNSQQFSKIVLWFEHDLYDQLQLLQILDWFHEHPQHAQRLFLIQTNRYLGMATCDDIRAFTKLETPVSSTQLQLAQQVWAAFRSPTPEHWRNLLNENTSALPHLKSAILRQLEEYPDTKTRLPKTERVAMELIARGEHHPGRLFGAWSKTEEPMFMGDWSFFRRLKECMSLTPPLIQQTAGAPLDYRPTPDQIIEVTHYGKQVLQGQKKAQLFEQQTRWIGGVELNKTNLWLWNPDSLTIQEETR